MMPIGNRDSCSRALASFEISDLRSQIISDNLGSQISDLRSQIISDLRSQISDLRSQI
jgi:hypothetical protein